MEGIHGTMETVYRDLKFAGVYIVHFDHSASLMGYDPKRSDCKALYPVFDVIPPFIVSPAP